MIVYAGSFGTSYDVVWLVELAAELERQSGSFRVLLYGEGASSDLVRARAVELGLDPDEISPGRLPKSEITRILPAADFSASTLIDSPALEVNSLNKVFDALAAATPVLFNHSGWLPYLLEAQGAGIKLPRDPVRAAAKLSGFVAADRDHQTRSDAALALGSESFSRDRLFSTFLDKLETVARRKR
ncbi:glycosyltransferase [Nesterenkonia aurantiaca]|uniref:glycosyltransferase n=1 Tax=Nesterenkonia aurantiaca TaxID=1436010 RepID=UPI003EE7F302